MPSPGPKLFKVAPTAENALRKSMFWDKRNINIIRKVFGVILLAIAGINNERKFKKKKNWNNSKK